MSHQTVFMLNCISIRSIFMRNKPTITKSVFTFTKTFLYSKDTSRAFYQYQVHISYCVNKIRKKNTGIVSSNMKYCKCK